MAPPPTDAPDGAPPATPTSPARAPLVAPPARAVAPSADDDALLLSALDAVSRSTPFARTPATGGAKRLAFSTPATTPLGPGAKAAATPASGLKVPGHDGDMCAVCYSPLAREGRGKTRAPGAFEDRDDAASSDPPDGASDPSDGASNSSSASDPKAELFTTACAHVFHRCCLVRCREADFSTCPMCRAALPPGLTPEHVREARAARRLEEARNARQNAIVGAAARAREAVRAQYVRSVVNGTRSGIPGIRRGSQGPAVGRISEEAETEGVETNASGEMPPWMSPPRSRTTGGGGGGRSASGGGGSAPATPARVPAAREGFVTAAEDLRRRAEAAELAVSVAYGVASAPSTPARGLGGGGEGAAEGLGPEETPLGRVGTVGSVVGDATAGPGNAATLAGVALADADFFRNAAAALLREESTSTSTRGGRSRDDEDENDEDAVAIALGAEGSGSAAGSARFRTAAEELARRAEASSFAAALLVANGTASAPATPATGRGVGARGRPALSAAFDAAEAAAAEGDDDAARRALRLARRLEAFEA